MRAAPAILLLVWLATACKPTASPSRSLAPFPPHTVADLQSLVQSLAPIQIPSTASDIHAARIPRSYATYTNLFSYFFAFRCSPEEAAQIIGTHSPLDNSITLDLTRITVTNDLETGIDRPLIVPARFPEAPVFPDVFFENHDLSAYRVLRVRVSDSPEWFVPHTVRRGIADRCVWKRGQIHVEFYYDADSQTMFLRFDELRPE